MSACTTLRRCLFAAAIALGSLSTTAHAQVTTRDAEALVHFCESNFTTPVRVDGLQNDWENEVAPTFRVEQMIAGEYRLDWTGPNDASFLLWCRQTNDALYFAVVGRDNAVNAPKDEGKGDRIELWFEIPGSQQVVMAEIPLWPMLADGRSTVTFKHGQSGAVPGAEAIVKSRREGAGYFLEAKIPLTALGGSVGFEPIRFSAVHRDWDHDGGVEREAAVGTSVVVPGNAASLGMLQFGRFTHRLAQLLDARGLSREHRPRVFTWANVAGDARREWVGVLGHELIVTGEGMSAWPTAFVRVSDHETHEPLEIRALNIDTDPELEIVYRYRVTRMDNRSRAVSQEIIAIIDTTPSGLQVVAHQEVANEIQGVGRLNSEIEYRDRGNYTIVRIRRASGNISRGNYIDIDAGTARDYQEMLLPWDGASKIDIYNYGGGWTRIVD